MNRDEAQERIDRILERPGYRRTEWAIWCSNPIWTHPHELHLSREQADDLLAHAEAKGCHGPAQFFLLERDVAYGPWRQVVPGELVTDDADQCSALIPFGEPGEHLRCKKPLGHDGTHHAETEGE